MHSFVAVATSIACTATALAETELRIATYNIKFLDVATLPGEGDRESKIETVLDLMQADIIALQEIDDRDALHAVFDPDEWWLIIDDNSGERQDLALAVRRSLELPGFTADDQDADDEHFLFPASADNSSFPDRRDVLHVEVVIPDEQLSVHVLVVHAKSRFGGRASTEDRRVEASQQLLSTLESEFDDRLYVLLGDFNDAPDDRSLNILETGDPGAVGMEEDDEGPFLINLTEPLWAMDMVSHGRKTNELTADRLRVDLVDPGARDRNNVKRGTDENTGDILFDQILIPPSMLRHYAAGSVAIFDDAVGVNGNNTTRASDHLPVFADFVFDGTSVDARPAVRIVSLLPNPDGTDAGRETVTIRNDGAAVQALSGWKLRDRAGNEFALAGISVLPGSSVTITMTTFSMPLNNSGDDVDLLNASGDVVHLVTYTHSQVTSGARIHFE